MTTYTNDKPILVTGGTGKTGRRVAHRLARAGRQVRIGSRSASPRFDWQDPTTWEPVLRGVGSVYVAFQPDLAVPGADEVIRSFSELAHRQGVEHIVLLSGRGEPGAQRCEEVLQRQPLAWTIVRASVFNQNFSEYFLLEPVRSGLVAFPAGAVAEPFIDVEDVADVAVAALTDDRHRGQVYEVTGPRLLTFAQAVGEIAAATGLPVRYIPVSPAPYAAALTTHAGVPEAEAAMLAGLFATIFDGRNAYLSDGVQRALGRPPREFRDYVTATASTGVWNPPSSRVDQSSSSVARR